jgi:hypothetical protein
MRIINKFMIKRIIIFISVITLACNQEIKENKAFTSEKQKKELPLHDESNKNDTVFVKLIDITNALGGDYIKDSKNKFTDISIKFIGNMVLVNGEKLPFSKEKIILEKITGIGTRYECFRKYIKEKFDININKESTVNYLNFEHDITYNEGAIYIYPYLFFYRINSNNYNPELLTFKLSSPIRECMQKSTISLPSNKRYHNEKFYIMEKNCLIKGISGWEHKGNFKYISFPSKENIDLVLVPFTPDGESYRYYMLAIKDNTVLDDLYVEGEWQAPNNSGPDFIETTYFKISKDYTIYTYTEYDRNIIERKYKINDLGKFIELKK